MLLVPSFTIKSPNSLILDVPNGAEKAMLLYVPTIVTSPVTFSAEALLVTIIFLAGSVISLLILE